MGAWALSGSELPSSGLPVPPAELCRRRCNRGAEPRACSHYNLLPRGLQGQVLHPALPVLVVLGETPLTHPSALSEVLNNAQWAWSGWAALTQKARGNMSQATTDGH